MNRKQKIVAAAGVCLILLAWTFPPCSPVSENGSGPVGDTKYVFIGSLFDSFAYFDTVVDADRLAMELLLIAGFTGPVLLLLGGQSATPTMAVATSASEDAGRSG